MITSQQSIQGGNREMSFQFSFVCVFPCSQLLTGNLSISTSALNMAKGGELSEDAYPGESGNVDCGSLTLTT